MQSPHLTGIQSHSVQTSRLEHYVLSCGKPNGTPIIFVHGNFSGASYFEEIMLSMPDSFYCIAPDLRGYGDSEDQLIDARRGARDWSDDLLALMKSLNIEKAHFVGWSAGAAPIMQLAIDHSEKITSLCLIAPISPFGFGGTKDTTGTPCYEDFSGSGGGTVTTDFIERISQRDFSDIHALSPRNVIRNSFFAQAMIMDREDQLLAVSMKQKLGLERYPGDTTESDNWPHVAPGQHGPINAISPKYFNVTALTEIENKPPVLWVHGANDFIISDQSYSDFGHLGSLGLVNDWPGNDIFPAQPMVSQMRYILEQYGNYHEFEMKNVGHSPFIERPDDFRKALLDHIS